MGRIRVDECGVMARLGQAGVEAADGIYAFLGRDHRVREAFPLPSAEERERWFQFWDKDSDAWESVVAMVLGKVPLRIRKGRDDKRILWSFDKTDRFFASGDKHLDRFFRSLEVRFALRVFLPCLAKKFERPSKLLNRIVTHENVYLLEMVAGIDPTIICHPRVYGIINPPNSEVRRERWALLNGPLATPPESIERRQVKYGIAGFLRWVSKARADRPTVPALFAMFNTNAKASGDAIGNKDPDFTDDLETFRKGSQRFANKLPSLG